MTDRESPDANEHGCYVAPVHKETDPERIRGRALARFALSGLGCSNCAARVRNALLSLDGVIAADVTLAPQQARVTFDPTQADPDQLTAAVHWAGIASRHRYSSAIVDVAELSTSPATSPSR